MREVKLPVQLLNDILMYLAKRPYEEVAILINNINTNHKIIDTAPETTKKAGK